MGRKLGSALELAKIATPANPDSGYTKVYVKSDDKVYVKTSGGTETLVGPAAGTVDAYVSGLATTGTATIDASNGEGVYESATLTGNVTIAFSNVPASGAVIYEYRTTQHASAAKTITLPSGSTPFPATFATPAVGKKIRMWFETVNGGTNWDVYQQVQS